MKTILNYAQLYINKYHDEMDKKAEKKIISAAHFQFITIKYYIIIPFMFYFLFDIAVNALGINIGEKAIYALFSPFILNFVILQFPRK